ncbi:MAG: hypothetical protein ABSB96_11840 [Gaiellaceae bacterium]
MAREPSAPARARPSLRVWLLISCAIVVIVFLANVLPGVFDLKHGKRTYVISGPIERIVFDSKGTADLDISPSRDGRVHVRRSSAISDDSRLIERHQVSGKTLTLTSSCTGSRLGVLRRCELHYQLQVPKKVALSIRVHFGRATVNGFQGRLDFRSDAGDFVGSGCSKFAYLSLGFGRVEYHDTCVPKVARVRVRAGDIELIVPAGRYAVRAKSNWKGSDVKRPFENIIEDPGAPNRLDAELTWAGTIKIKGTSR